MPPCIGHYLHIFIELHWTYERRLYGRRISREIVPAQFLRVFTTSTGAPSSLTERCARDPSNRPMRKDLVIRFLNIPIIACLLVLILVYHFFAVLASYLVVDIVPSRDTTTTLFLVNFGAARWAAIHFRVVIAEGLGLDATQVKSMRCERTALLQP